MSSDDSCVKRDGNFYIKKLHSMDELSPSLCVRHNTVSDDFINTVNKHQLTNVTVNKYWGWDGREKEISFVNSLPAAITGLEVITNEIDLTDINHFKSCEKLCLNCDFKGKINTANLSNLLFLSCKWNPKKISNIEQLNKLETLHLSNYNLPDLTFLQNLKHLKKLVLYSAKKLTSLSGLEYLTSLEYLSIDASNSLTDISALRCDNKMLQYLDICNCKNLVEVDSISHLTSLKKLSLYYLNKSAFFPNFNQLTNLKEGFVDKKLIDCSEAFLKEHQITLFPLKLVFHEM